MQGDTYFTVHVTPQSGCSWVSFETNIERVSYSALISHVLDLFKPGKCVVSLFASKVGECIVRFPQPFLYLERVDVLLC